MNATHVFAGVPVADYRSALEWYERLLGRPPDSVPKEDEAVWQLADTGLIYLVVDARRAGNALVTLIVNDLEKELDGLAERGIAVGVVDTVPGVVRTTVITDPEGNTIQLGELIAKGG